VRAGPRGNAVVGLLSIALVVVLAGCGGPGSPVAAARNGPDVLTGGRGQLSSATLDVVNGSTAVRVSNRPLGADLYRVSTPEGSGTRPLASRRGRTVLVGDASTAARSGVPTLDVTLARGVRWTIDLDGGATTETVDMEGGRLSALDFGGGVSRASVELPAPVGTETVTLTGGASQLLVVAPPGPPAQVSAVGGASDGVVDGARHTGVAGGSVFTDPGWSTSRNRYAIALTAGVSDFRMTRT